MYGVYLVNYMSEEASNISKMLSRSKKGFKVIGCNTDADMAIDEIISLRPDVVITELRTRKMSGNTLMQRVREAGIGSEFIILTDTYSHNELRTFFTGGGFDYWLKSFDISEVENVLEKLAHKLSSANSFMNKEHLP